MERQPWLLRPADFGAVFPGLDDFDATRLTCMPVRTHEESLVAAAETGGVAATYLHCTATPDAFGEMARRAEADGMTISKTNAGHKVITTHPAEVARVLLNAAAHMDKAPRRHASTMAPRTPRENGRPRLRPEHLARPLPPHTEGATLP